MKALKRYTRSVSIFSSLLFTIFSTITESEAGKNIPVDSLPVLLDIQKKNHHYEIQVAFHDPVLQALPAQTMQHLALYSGRSANLFNNQEAINAAFQSACASYVFRGMLNGLPALDVSAFGGGAHYLVFQEINYIQSQILEMIRRESNHQQAHAIYFGMNHRYAAYQDLFKELNQIFLCNHLDGSYRFGGKLFENLQFQDFKNQVLAHPEKDNCDLFKILGGCASLTPLQTSSVESATDFWTHNWNISRSDLLPIILGELDLNNRLSAEERDELDAIIAIFHEKARALGGRMKQLFVSSKDLDEYVWLSGRNGYEIESVYKDEQGIIRPTTDPSKALVFYRTNPDEFIKEHRKHFDQVVRPRLGENIRNATYEGDFSNQNNFLTRDNDKHHLCQLQFRVYLHPELMFSDRIKIYEYNSKDVSENDMKAYKKYLSEVTQKLVSLWIKHHPNLLEGNFSKHLPKQIKFCEDCKRDFKEIYPDYDKEEQIEAIKNEPLEIGKLNLEDQKFDHLKQFFHKIQLNRNELKNLRDTIAASYLNELSVNPDADYIEVSEFISNRLIQIFHSIVDESIQVVGESPSKFCIYTNGSLARKEASLYSDLEIGFLVETKNAYSLNYIYRLTEEINQRLQKLGEKESGGLRFDEADHSPLHTKPGQLKSNNRNALSGSRLFVTTPLEKAEFLDPSFVVENNRKNNRFLIETKQQSIENLMREAIAGGAIALFSEDEVRQKAVDMVDNLYNPLSAKELDVLPSLRHLSRSMAYVYGDHNLFKKYMTEANRFLGRRIDRKNQQSLTQREEIVRLKMDEAISTARFLDYREIDRIDVKRQFYRFVEILLTNLAFVHKFDPDLSSRRVAEMLCEEGKISQILRDDLIELLNAAHKFRLKESIVLKKQGDSDYCKYAFLTDAQFNYQRRALSEWVKKGLAPESFLSDLEKMKPGVFLMQEDINNLQTKFFPMMRKIRAKMIEWQNGNKDAFLEYTRNILKCE